MNYTVAQLAKLSGVTVRTLHFYDEIGLLRPAFVGEQGYRYYQEEQLLTLQQILFYRDLGFELKQIQQIIEKKDEDRVELLQTQKDLVRTKIERLQTLLNTIDKTINYAQGKTHMNEKELFEGLEIWEADSEKQKNYEKQLAEYMEKKYGSQKAASMMKGSQQSVAKLSPEKQKVLTKQFEDICNMLVRLIEQGKKPNNPEVQALIRRHYEFLKHFWTPTKESYSGHADFILETEFRKAYEKYDTRLPEFIAAGIKIFAQQLD